MENKMLKVEYVFQLKRGITFYFVLVKEPFQFHDHIINMWICIWTLTLALSVTFLLVAMAWKSRLVPKSELWVQSINVSNIQRVEKSQWKIILVIMRTTKHSITVHSPDQKKCNKISRTYKLLNKHLQSLTWKQLKVSGSLWSRFVFKEAYDQPYLQTMASSQHVFLSQQ